MRSLGIPALTLLAGLTRAVTWQLRSTPAQLPMMESPTVTLDEAWQLLGPFQIGTREAAWGADPLEYLGGFHNIRYDTKAKYKSSLAPNGSVSWGEQLCGRQASDEAYACSFGFPDIDWSSLRLVYGWPALQWQAWARSSFTLAGEYDCKVLLHLDGVLEFWIDDERVWGGDYYGLHRAPIVLSLSPGSHRIELRLIRDVRAMGAADTPKVNIALDFLPLPTSTMLVDSYPVVPDVVHDRLVSDLGSITLTNILDEAIEVLDIASIDEKIAAHMHEYGPINILPGQTRPVAFQARLLDGAADKINLGVAFRTSTKEQLIHNVNLPLQHRDLYAPQKFTFMHPGAIVSYAMLKLPSAKAALSMAVGTDMPIMLYMHGSGVRADNDEVTHSFDGIDNLPALILFVEGVTSWCGDDWHNWGWRDVEAALAAVPSYLDRITWTGPQVNSSRWLIAGHSNGGQGVWYALAHHPDKIIAAAPASGYLSIQAYVPYNLWSETEPARNAIVQSALNSYRHELLIPSHAKQIPVAIQHGTVDDNVPVFHSRRMFQLIAEGQPEAKFNEVSGKNHVFDGMMQTPFFREFYSQTLQNRQEPAQIPAEFTVVTANPSDTGPKFGVKIEELRLPGRLGKVDAKRVSSRLTFKTSNVIAFTLDCGLLLAEQLHIDNEILEVPSGHERSKLTFCRNNNKWSAHEYSIDNRPKDSNMSHLGGLDAIFRSSGALTVMECHPSASRISKQISRNLLQYYGADSRIVQAGNVSQGDGGNIIVLAIGAFITAASDPAHPIHVSSNSIHISTMEQGEMEYVADEKGLGAVFLRPGPCGRLELVVWGTDENSLAIAARLVPMITGTGQPDFVILNRQMMWSGIDGTLALGFFDGKWRVPAGASYLS